MKVDSKTGARIAQANVSCVWSWTGASWTAGDPTEVTYGVRFWCNPFSNGPKMGGLLQARLFELNGDLIHEAEETLIHPDDPNPSGDDSEGTATVQRPKTLYVQNHTEVTMTTPGWVWQSLPEGCTGIGSPLSVCDIDFDDDAFSV